MNEKYLVFQVANSSYCTPISDVLAITNLDSMLKTSRVEMKISLWSNRTLPVLDIIAATSIQEAILTKDSRIIVLETKGFKVGFLVDAILGISEFNSQEIRDTSASETRFVKSYIQSHKLIDFSHFLNSNTIPLVKKATTFDSAFLEEESSDNHFRLSEREILLQHLKLEAANLLIEANRKKLDKYYLDSFLKINQMIEAI